MVHQGKTTKIIGTLRKTLSEVTENLYKRFYFLYKNKTVLQGLEKVFAEIRIKRKARFCYKQDEDKKRACPDDEHQSAGQALHISRITFQEYLPV